MGLAATTIVVSLVGAESAALIATRYKVLDYYSPMITMLPKGTEDWRLAHVLADEQRIPDPVLWWRPLNRRPYNSHGFKGREIHAAKQPGVFRVIGYGDSNTEGSDQGDWPQELQSVLDAASTPGGSSFEVLNAGVAGYSSHQGLLRFKQEFSEFGPDLVLVSFGWNDLATALGRPDNTFTPPSAIFVRAQRLFLRFRFYLCLKHYLDRLRPPEKDIFGHRVPLDDYLANMRGFLSIARRNKMKIAFLTRPHRAKTEDMKKSPGWRAEVPLYNQELLRLGRKEDVLVIDVQKEFEDHPSGAFMDDCHLTREGFQRMSRFVYRELVAHGLLQGPTRSGR